MNVLHLSKCMHHLYPLALIFWRVASIFIHLPAVLCKAQPCSHMLYWNWSLGSLYGGWTLLDISDILDKKIYAAHSLINFFSRICPPDCVRTLLRYITLFKLSPFISSKLIVCLHLPTSSALDFYREHQYAMFSRT